jgi:hypothetical protein
MTVLFIFILGYIIGPCAGGPMFPLARGLIPNNLQSRSNNLRQSMYNLSFTTTTHHATIIHWGSGLHPWKGYGWLSVRIDEHPWKWYRPAGIRVGTASVSLLFYLRRCCFCLCYFVKQFAHSCQCISCFCLARHRALNALVSSDAAFNTSVSSVSWGFVMY